MKRTLYVSDMDGTLLNSASQVSARTETILNNVISEGGLFTVATARTPATVVRLMQGLETTLPYIVLAGAAMWDNSRRQYTNVRPLLPATVRCLLEIYHHHAVHPFVYRRHGNVIEVFHRPSLSEDEQAFIAPRVHTPFKRLVTTDELPESTDETMLVYSMGSYAALQCIADEIRQYAPPCTVAFYHDIFDHSQGILEIYAPQTSKAEAIRQLAMQCRAERVVVFGDNLNDIPMMKVADYSLAVSNAFDEVKAVADEVLPNNNDEDAVAEWILREWQPTTARHL